MPMGRARCGLSRADLRNDARKDGGDCKYEKTSIHGITPHNSSVAEIGSHGRLSHSQRSRERLPVTGDRNGQIDEGCVGGAGPGSKSSGLSTKDASHLPRLRPTSLPRTGRSSRTEIDVLNSACGRLALRQCILDVRGMVARRSSYPATIAAKGEFHEKHARSWFRASPSSSRSARAQWPRPRRRATASRARWKISAAPSRRARTSR